MVERGRRKTYLFLGNGYSRYEYSMIIDEDERTGRTV